MKMSMIVTLMAGRTGDLQKKLDKLSGYRDELKGIAGITYEQFRADKGLKYSIERMFLLISRNILDCLDHVLATRIDIIGDSYEDIIENAYRKSMISPALYSQLKYLAFLGSFADEYLDLSDEEIFRKFRETVPIIDEVIAGLAGMITQRKDL